jgi:hypothetical protein
MRGSGFVMSLTSLGIKGFLASDKGMALGFVGIFTTSIGYGIVILSQGQSGKPEPSHAPQTFALVSATDDTAVLASAEGLHKVHVGSVLPYLGIVTGIVDEAGQWKVTTSSGHALTIKTPSR